MYDKLTGTLFFPFSEGMSSHERELEIFLSRSLSPSSWFSSLSPEVTLVIDLGEWCTSSGVGMTVLSNLLNLVCTALRSLDNSLSCWLNLKSDCHHIEWSLFEAWVWFEFIHQTYTFTFKQLLIGPNVCVCARACACAYVRACVCALAYVRSCVGKTAHSSCSALWSN